MRILVVESESRHAERAKDGLGSDGWSVEVVTSAQAAAASAAGEAPQLVIVNAELDGARDLLRRYARAHGGPGAIALVPEMPNQAANAAAKEADETLTKPFQDVALRQLARRVVSSERGPKPDADSKRLTSHELFGDLLAEVENEMAVPEPPPAPTPAPRPAAPAVAAGTDAMTAKLEKTLSGMLGGEKSRPAAAAPGAPAKKSSNIDEMLSRTLSGLDVGKKPARPATATPPAVAPAARTAPAPAAPQPAPEAARPPAPAPAPTPAAAPTPPAPVAAAPVPVEAPKPPAPKPAPPKAAPAPPAPLAPILPKFDATPTPSKRPSREIDLTQLDALAAGGKTRSKDSTGASKPGAAARPAENFATQKISVTPSFLQPPSSEFGQYTLLERIAIGGMAEVWKARMKGVEGFQKTVAIKKILPHLTDSSDFVTMFIDEAKLAAQLNHNNIIHIYDLGKINDDYFIAMEYVDGKDLRAILNQARADSRPLPMNLALFVGSRLASALDHAHRQKDFEGRSLGLVHRDVSPQNVLISYEGDIKLCDFGIVKAVTKASKTQMGALKGKLQYMSPEQAWGRPVDARSDLFSLGSLLFEMLTGRRLFSGESEMSVLDAVREGRIQAPRDLDPRLPLEINALVLKSLARDPDDRFQTASEMQREIDSILTSLKPPPSQSELGAYLTKLFEAERSGGAAAFAGGPPSDIAPALAASPAAASTAVPKKAEVSVVKPTGVSKIEEAEGGKGSKMLWIAIGGAAAAGLIAFLLLRGKGGEAPSAAPPATPPAAAAEAAPESAPGVTGTAAVPVDGAASPAPATAPSSVDQMVSAEVKKREDELKKRYEDELAKRRAEIDKLNKPAAASATTSTAAAPPAAEPEPQPVETAPAEPEPAPAPAPVEAAPEPLPTPVEAVAAAPTVKEGDLVQRGAGVVPPVLATFNKPEYPPIARRLKVEGTVVLSMLVDETGRVIDTRLESGVSQNVGINEAALSAARTAKFTPATKNGVRVKMWYQLKIPFKL